MIKLSLALSFAWCVAHAAFAAEIPSQPLAPKGPLLFADDFEGPALGKSWAVSTPTFVVVDGMLKGDHTFKGRPAENGKPARPSHGAVALVQVNRKDMIIEFRLRMDTATSVNAVCDDMAYKESHGSHIVRLAFTPNKIRLGDDKESLSHKIEEMKADPNRRAEAAKLIEGHVLDVPFKIDPQHWYRVSIEIVGDEMRALLDDKPIGYLKSSGLAHPNKSRFHFTVSGGHTEFDDFKIWNVAAK